MRSLLHQKIGQIYSSKRLIYGIIFLGIILRLVQYLWNRSLWLDESLLALNIIDRSFLELFQPLSYNQGAPVGFLVTEKLAVQIFNTGEYALRLVPLISGIASLFFFYGAAKRIIKPGAMPVAVGLFAISSSLIYYSSEVKQYSSDVFIATVLLYLATGGISSKNLIDLRTISMGLLGAIAVWFSHPALFVLAGIGVSQILCCLFKKDRKRIAKLALICSVWALSFSACYLVSLNDLSNNEELLNYWSDSFMPFPPGSLSDIQWYWNTLFVIFINPIGLKFAGISFLAFLIGATVIFSKERMNFFILILPIVFTLLGSALNLYPFRGRLLLFLTPFLLIVIAEGIEEIRAKTRPHSALIGITILGLLFFHPLLRAANNLIKPQAREEIKPVVDHLRRHQKSGDILYLYWGSRYPYKYYSKRFNSGKNYIEGSHSKGNLANYVAEMNKLRGNKRVWLLFSHVSDFGGIDEKKFMLYYLDTIGTELESYRSSGASVYLYDLDKKTTQIK